MSGGLNLDRQSESKLEEFGVENVRIALTNNTLLPVPDKGIAWRWLREKDARRFQSDRVFARWTLIVAIVAAVAAIVAAVASVIPLLRHVVDPRRALGLELVAQFTIARPEGVASPDYPRSLS